MTSTYRVIGTTRSQQKARQISNSSTQGLVYALGDDTTALCKDIANATLVLNIPPGRRNTQLDAFTANMVTLINDVVRANVARIIFISTTSVYGDARDDILNEQAATMPETASAKAHVAIEKHLLDLSSSNKVQVKIVRLAGLTGPDRHPVNSLSGRTLSAGNKRVNLVHIEDVITALKTMITADNYSIEGGALEGGAIKCSDDSKEVYHLCSLLHPKRGEYYTQAAKKKGIPAPAFSDSELPAIGKCINAKASWDLLGIVPDYANPDDMI